ncbi:MAG TPA: M1 family aminopeptidase [Armatimonadota bacterium]|nr:M1 family aminopeptidase [Armatimonadota bacterium]
MLPLLLVVNGVVWLALLAYCVLSPRFRRWNGWLALVGVVAAVALSAASYRYATQVRVKERYARHYHAGIDERDRGNLEEAERQFQQALAVEPSSGEARKQLEEIRTQNPAEKREQDRETRVEPVPAPAPSPSPAGASPAARPAPGEKPKPAPHKRSPFEITRYALDVAIDPAASSLDATARIRVRSRGDAVSRLELSLNPQFKPSAVQLDGAPARFEHINDLLAVTPARPLAPDGEATVTVRYRRVGPPILKETLDLISKEAVYLRSESRWYPATGELDFRSPVSVTAKVPKGFSVVSVGSLKSTVKEGKWVTYHWETDRFASMVSLAAAPYVQKSVQVPLPATGAEPGGSLKITCYTFPKHRDRADAFLKEAAAITRFFQRHLGPYPYEKLAVVEIPLFPGGYGTTSFVMLIDQSFAQKAVDREFLAHEIAHQWWGNSVFPQGLGAAWLTEAFANYCAWMYEASVTGNPRVLQKRVAKATHDYFKAAAKKGDQPIYETDPYQQVGAAQEILYEKGAVVLHMLRRQVGDKPFLRTLRTFADRYRFGKAKIEDFRKIAEEQGGQPLGWFFDQWLGRTGGMALTYSFETEGEGTARNEAVLTVTQREPYYRGKVKVVLDVENSIQTADLEIAGARQVFRFPVKGKLTNVLLDPDNALLMQRPQWVVADARR